MGITYYTGDGTWPSETTNTVTGEGTFSVEIEITNNSTDVTWSGGNTGTIRVRVPPPKRVVVPLPKHWTEQQALAFVDLINLKTKTGWKVTSLVRGDILICDPTIEKRPLRDFLPLLKLNANGEDASAIDRFIEEAKLEA